MKRGWDDSTMSRALRMVRREIRKYKVPAVGLVAEAAADRPFETLVSTVLSLRTKDAVTGDASRRILSAAPTPAAVVALPEEEIARLIYPVGFYRTKAKNLRRTCRILVDQYGGSVPRELDELLKLPGVGRKTANLVVTIGFGDYGICVDTHVHRISNIWGYVETRMPDETEQVLRRKLPRRYWKEYNDLLVTFGQNLCVPVSPWCSRCPLAPICPRLGVKRSR